MTSDTSFQSTYDDFMEIWLQFGHVFLFSSVYPLAGFFALLNNFMELRMDAYKLCTLMRKPTPRGVRDIGAWYMVRSKESFTFSKWFTLELDLCRHSTSLPWFLWLPIWPCCLWTKMFRLLHQIRLPEIGFYFSWLLSILCYRFASLWTR